MYACALLSPSKNVASVSSISQSNKNLFSGLNNAGIRDSFSDIGATIGKFFGVEVDEGTVIE